MSKAPVLPLVRALALAALALLAGTSGAKVRPASPSKASTLVVVDIASQRLVAYRDGVPIASSPVSTGRPGYATPLGVFTILEKDMFHRSNQYSDAPMPHMQRLTWGGVALHGGDLPGYPASHGCIRLPYDFARRLFGETRMGATVMVINQRGWRGAAKGGGGVPAFWRPGLSAHGPVSIVVSGADRRMMVLRDGVAIGSAPVAFQGVIEHPQAYVLRASGWERVALPGEAPRYRASAATPEPGVIDGGSPFQQALGTVLTPGATMLVVPESLSKGIGSVPPPAEIEDAQVMAEWHADAEVTGGR